MKPPSSSGSARIRSRASRSGSRASCGRQKNRPRLAIGSARAAANSKAVTTPKLPPPPRSAQNRSGFCCSEAVTTSTVRGDQLGRHEVVAAQAGPRVSQPMPPPSVSPATPVWLTPAGHGQPVLGGGGIHCGPGRPASTAGPPCGGVDGDVAEPPEVDHDRTVGHGMTGVTVAASAHGHLHPVPARLGQQLADLGRRLRLHDDGRSAPDVPVPDRSRDGGVIAVVPRRQHRPRARPSQIQDGGVVDNRHGPTSEDSCPPREGQDRGRLLRGRRPRPVPAGSDLEVGRRSSGRPSRLVPLSLAPPGADEPSDKPRIADGYRRMAR